MIAQRKPLDAAAVSVMVLLCLIWGIGHVVAKFTAQGISLVLQSGLRSVIATVLLLVWVYFRKTPLWERDRTLWPGVFAGLLFATEFVFIFGGLALTDAARMVVFVYLAPCITALGLHFLVPAERLNARQWAGIWSRSQASRSLSATVSRAGAARCWATCAAFSARCSGRRPRC